MRQLKIEAVMIVVSVALVLYGCSMASAQIQLMPKEKEQALRASIPKIEDEELAAKIAEATLYTDAEMPPAYQFQPILGGRGADYTVFYSPEMKLNNLRRFTNNNKEFPWRTPGGMDAAEGKSDEFRFIWLPKQTDGKPYPVVVYRGPLEKSNSVNMPIPQQGYRWVFPQGTILGEVLVMNFSDGYRYTFEMRIRKREKVDWEVEIFRPFPTLTALEERIEELDPGLTLQLTSTPVQERTLEDTQHPNRAFKAKAGVFRLPALPKQLVKRLLTETTFKKSMGQYFHEQGGVTVFAPTADNDENIVPKGYTATFLGTDKESCAKCHQHTLKHVDRFQLDEWYGYTRGSDGIFSFHPVDPGSIGYSRPVRFRKAFLDAGMVEAYDPARHPVERYMIAPEFENLPAKSYPNTGRVTIGG